MSISQHIPEPIKRVSRSIGYALWLGGVNPWHGVSVVLTSTASGDQRKALAWAVLRSLTPDQIVAVVETVLPEGSSVPIAPLFNHMDEAAFWADMAEPDALEAYCLASFNAMLRPRQVAFLDFVQGRKAA
jgi:hypothetical protein